MARRTGLLVASCALVVASLATGAVPARAAEGAPLPASMAAVGDSITQAASSGGSLGADYPANSWSTGTSSSVSSHYQRLLAAGAPIAGAAYNRSVSGAKVADLNGQMQTVTSLQPDYLTVLIGGNDLCTDTVAEMTSVADFRARFAAAMATLAAGSPDTYVHVVSIPDAYQLWNLFRGNWWARFVWSAGDICQSLLANPTSTQAADVQRRATVRQRNVDYNTQLAEVCAQFASRCRFDGNAVFNTVFTIGDVSGDYFHPSVAGQAKLAAVTWSAGFTWTAGPAPNHPPSAAFDHACSGLGCAFTDASTDDDGTIVAWHWGFGDGTASTAQHPTHSYAAAGAYAVTLTVTDDDGATASATGSVTVSAPGAAPMWVTDLAGSTSTTKKGWSASVTTSVAGAAGAVAGVTVTATWSAGTASGSCVTGAAGTCTITSANLNKRTTGVTFTVTALARSGWVYAPGSNLETALTLARP